MRPVRRRQLLGIVIRLLLLALVPVILLALAVPGLMQSRRAANERNASASLKTITSAQADFRANDRDANGVNDFWTADVAGLYTLKDIRLIEREVAAADAAPLLPLSRTPASRQGYRYQALVYDNSVQGDDMDYRQSTVPGGPPHYNRTRFGFGAYPETTRQGTYQYLVNENNTIFRFGLQEHGLMLEWPSDRVLKSFWGG